MAMERTHAGNAVSLASVSALQSTSTKVSCVTSSAAPGSRNTRRAKVNTALEKAR